MRRQIRVKIDLVAEVDDDRDGIPWVGDVDGVLSRVAGAVLPRATGVLPGGRLSMGLTPASITAARRARGAGAR